MRNTTQSKHTTYCLEGKQDAGAVIQYASLQYCLCLRGESGNFYTIKIFTREYVMKFLCFEVCRKFRTHLRLILFIDYFLNVTTGCF